MNFLNNATSFLKRTFRFGLNIIKFIFSRLIFIALYDRKYLESIYFKGSIGPISAVGWDWVMNDFRSRLFYTNNRGIKFPVSNFIRVQGSENIHFHPDDLNNFQGYGNYYQAIMGGEIYIGKGTWIASNVGIITSNHDVNNLENHEPGRSVIIGENCWIGMNSVVLPGVILGDNTIVGAGSIVTKSFKGDCVVAGNPAKIIRQL